MKAKPMKSMSEEMLLAMFDFVLKEMLKGRIRSLTIHKDKEKRLEMYRGISFEDVAKARCLPIKVGDKSIENPLDDFKDVIYLERPERKKHIKQLYTDAYQELRPLYEAKKEQHSADL